MGVEVEEVAPAHVGHALARGERRREIERGERGGEGTERERGGTERERGGKEEDAAPVSFCIAWAGSDVGAVGHGVFSVSGD